MHLGGGAPNHRRRRERFSHANLGRQFPDDLHFDFHFPASIFTSIASEYEAGFQPNLEPLSQLISPFPSSRKQLCASLSALTLSTSTAHRPPVVNETRYSLKLYARVGKSGFEVVEVGGYLTEDALSRPEADSRGVDSFTQVLGGDSSA